MSVRSFRTQADFIQLPYPNNAALCCPPCQVPRKNLNLTIYLGPVPPGDLNVGTRGYDPGGSTCGGMNCANSPVGNGTNCIQVTRQYVQRAVSQDVSLIYNATTNIWRSDWYYSLGKTAYGTGTIAESAGGSPQQPSGLLNCNPRTVTVDTGFFTFSRWIAYCTNTLLTSTVPNSVKFSEGFPLTLYVESVSFSGSSTDDGPTLFSNWQNSPTFYKTPMYVDSNIGPIKFTPGSFFGVPNTTAILQCSPFLYQIAYHYPGSISSTGYTLTAP